MSGPQAIAPSRAAQGAEIYHLGLSPETVTERVQRLQSEARLLAREQVEALDRDLQALARRAEEIAAGGEAYPPGVRELASRIAADLPQKGLTLLAILQRTARD